MQIMKLMVDHIDIAHMLIIGIDCWGLNTKSDGVNNKYTTFGFANHFTLIAFVKSSSSFFHLFLRSLLL